MYLIGGRLTRLFEAFLLITWPNSSDQVEPETLVASPLCVPEIFSEKSLAGLTPGLFGHTLLYGSVR